MIQSPALAAILVLTLQFKSRRRSTAWIATAFLSLLFSLPLCAQDNGSISGTVMDGTGAVVSGATITAARLGTHSTSTTTTDDTGRYVFPSLLSAHYSVTIRARGFQTVEESDVVVRAHQTLNLMMTLKVGSTSSTIQVAATAGSYAELAASSATRTNTPLLEIPQSVEVINHALLTGQDAHTLADVLVNVSGVTPVKPEEVLLTSPIVRGFPAEVYLNGLPMYGATQTANDPTSLIGVERVEVVKGPTSTLYGGGVGSPLGGLINVETERPESRLGGVVALRGGSFTTLDPYADLNIPLSSRIAARFAGEYLGSQSWVDRVEGDRWSAQPSLSFHLSPRTSLIAQGQYGHRGQLEYSGLPAAQALAGLLDRNAFPGASTDQRHTTINTLLTTVNLRHAFKDNLRLDVSGRFYRSNNPEFGSFVYPSFYPPASSAPTVYPILALNMVTTVKEGSLDANLLAKTHILKGRHELLAGVDYDHIDFSSNMGFSGVAVGEIDLAIRCITSPSEP